MESGITALKASDQTELGLDLLFKKPYRLSRTAEFMVGLGPEVICDCGGSDRTTSVDMEIILDFMFWPKTNVAGIWSQVIAPHLVKTPRNPWKQVRA